MEQRFPVALAKEVCPVCAKEVDGPILLGTRATRKHEGEHDIDKMHGQVIGFSNTMCADCKKQIGDNMWIVVYDSDKTENNDKVFNPYRCGIIIGVKREAIERIFEGHAGLPTFLRDGFVFMDYRPAAAMGIDVSSYTDMLPIFRIED